MTEHFPNPPLTRRGFLAGASGLTFALAFQPGLVTPASAAEGAVAMNAWVHIDPSGAITIYAPAAEMGQGVQTVVPLILAEELDADWDAVTVRTAPVDPAFAHPIFRGQYTVASLTVRGYWGPARTAGAQVRRVLIETAAGEWGLEPAELTTEASAVVGPDGRRMTYGEIAALGRVPAELPEIAPEELKPVAEYRLLGNDRIRVDVAEKSSGHATYAIDVHLPDMLYATVARAPVRGQTVATHNGDAVAAMDGVTHVLDLGHGVAVVGRSMPQVFAARAALEIDWTGDVPGTAIDSARDQTEYLDRMRDPANAPDVVFAEKGDTDAALAEAAEVMTREFVTEYCYHAQMEPMGATAWVRADAAEVWTGTQWQSMALNRTAAITGLDPAQVTIHQLYLGGGFGRRAHTEYIDDAVTIAKETGQPVKLLLSREDDVASARLRPLTAQRVSMALDADGRIAALHHAVACEPVSPYMYGAARWEADAGKDLITMRGSALPHYAVEHQRAVHYHEMRGARVAAWRGIGAGYTKFALETMIDEIARGRDQDPLDYRLALSANPRVTALLEKVAEMSDWRTPREGRGLGLAFAEYGESLGAAVAEISLDRDTGRIAVHNLWAAVDVGLPLQPDNIRAQIEGGMAFGLSAALKEEITIREGRIVETNFDDYEILRMDETPEIAVEILRGADAPTEVGELGLPMVAPALANAVFALTGRTVNHLPMTPERIRALL
jgi:isoquinoline 1-oxidoreductase subunit beta